MTPMYTRTEPAVLVVFVNFCASKYACVSMEYGFKSIDDRTMYFLSQQ